MNTTDVILNTSISFIIHSLEEYRKNGHEFLKPCIQIIDKYHKEYMITGNYDCFYTMIDKIYQTKHLDGLVEKALDVFSRIALPTEHKEYYKMLIVALLEFYQYFLKIQVQSYLKFKELNELIEYLNSTSIDDSNYHTVTDDVKKRLYNDVVVRMIVSPLFANKAKYTSFIDWLDSMFVKGENKGARKEEKAKDILDRKFEKYQKNQKDEREKYSEIIQSEATDILNGKDRIKCLLKKYSTPVIEKTSSLEESHVALNKVLSDRSYF